MARETATRHKPAKDLLHENQELKARLEEMEETLRAIREGEVDALVTGGPEGEQVFTLQSAERPYRLIVEQMAEGAATISPDGIVLFANRRLAEFLATSHEQIIGKSLMEFVAPDARPALQALLTMNGARNSHEEVTLMKPDGTLFPARVSASMLVSVDQPMISLVIADLTEQREAERSARLVESFALGISQAENVDAALEAVLHRIHEFTGWTFGEAWLPRPDRKILECTAAWYTDSPALNAVHEASSEASLPPGIGFPGRAWIAKEPVWVKDLAHDRGYFSVAAAREAGLTAGVAIPVLAIDQVVAVLSFFMDRPGRDDERLIRMIAGAAMHVSPALQRKIAEEEVRKHRAQLDEAQHIAHLGSWEWDIVEDRFTWSDEMYSIFGLSREQSALTLEMYLELLHPEDRASSRDAFERMRVDTEPLVVLQRVGHPDGPLKFLETRGHVVTTLAGIPDKVVGVSLDVTERKISEQNLLTAYDALETLVEERTAKLAAANQELQSEIVERKRTESELRKSQERVANMLESITDNYFALDFEWRFREVNDHALAYFGLTREELLGRTVWDVPSMGQDPVVRGYYDSVATGREPVHFEAFSPGIERWAEFHVYPSAEGVDIYFSEITARKLVEEALRQSEEQFRNVLDNSRDVVFEIDLPSYTYEYVSPAVESILGFTSRELMEMGVGGMEERIHAEDRERYRSESAALLNAPAGQRSGIIHYRWLCKDGQYRWMSASRSVVADPHGGPHSLIGSLRDITEQKNTEEEIQKAYRQLQEEVEQRKTIQEALESSELRYRAIVEELTDLVCRMKPDGSITFVNDAYRSFFGNGQNDVLGTNHLAAIFPDDLPRMRQLLGQLTLQSRSALLENRVVRRQNDIRWVQWTITALFDDAGALAEIQAVGRDIDERKNAEILLGLQYEVTRALAESGTVSEATGRVLRSICQKLGWDLGILWKVDTVAEMLRFEGIWHVSGVEGIMVEHSLLPEIDLPSRVWKRKKPLWIPGNAEGLEQTEITGGGFSSVLAFPVRTGGNVTAVVECFSQRPLQPLPATLQTLEAIGHQMGNYRERRIAEESVRKAAEELEARVKQRTEQLAGALEALSNSEMRFRAMFEGAPLGIALLSSSGVIIERNPTLERMLGYGEGELYGMPVNNITHPDDIPIAQEYFETLVDGTRTQYRMESRYIRRDGTILWGSVSCSSMHFEGSQAPFIITMIKDVTERKEMEEELRNSENRFRAIFEESPVGIALMDEHEKYVQVSPTFIDMMGYSQSDLLSKEMADISHPDDIDEDRNHFHDIVEGRRSRYQMEKRFIRRDGTVAWGNLNVAAIKSGTGEFLYGLRLVEDISRRKEVEQRMVMLAHTITSMNESVIITNVDLIILSVNDAFLKTFGYDEREILGKHVSFLKAPGASRRELVGILDGTMSGGWAGEMVVSRKNGEVFPIQLSTSVVRGQTGRPIALVGISRDITEQRRLQAQLAEAERRRSADLRRFAISVQRAQEDERQRISRELHDDICQRLSGMKLNMEVLEDDVREKDKKTFRALRGFKKQFEQTITEVRRMSSNLRPTVLDDFGLTIALNLLGREHEKAHKTKVKVETGDPTLKHLDPQVEIALYRIAQESLTNIAKHAGAANVLLRLAINGLWIKLTVQDDGKGFDQQELPRTKVPGHGLGLISMRERAELLGGTCQIQSAPNQGTTIEVTIPLEVSIDHEEN